MSVKEGGDSDRISLHTSLKKKEEEEEEEEKKKEEEERKKLNEKRSKHING